MCSKPSENNKQPERTTTSTQMLDEKDDPKIVKRAADGESNAVVLGDSNFALCIG